MDWGRQKIETAAIEARKADLATVVSEIPVDDHRIQIIGDKTGLATVIAGQQAAAGKTSGSARKWRTMRNKDDNSYLIEMAL